MLSGVALTLSDSARPDGPDSGGASVLFTVQPAAVRRASPIAARRRYVKDMILEVPKVAELDADLSCDAHRVAHAIGPVKRHFRDGTDDVRTGPQLNERRLLLRGGSDQFKAHRQFPACRNGA